MTEGGSHISSQLPCSHSAQSGGYPPPNRLSSPMWIWTRLIEVREVSLDRRGCWSVGARVQRDTKYSSETPKIPNTSIVFKDGNTVSDRSVSTNIIGYCEKYRYLSMQRRLENGRKGRPRNRWGYSLCRSKLPRDWVPSAEITELRFGKHLSVWLVGPFWIM